MEIFSQHSCRFRRATLLSKLFPCSCFHANFKQNLEQLFYRTPSVGCILKKICKRKPILTGFDVLTTFYLQLFSISFLGIIMEVYVKTDGKLKGDIQIILGIK